MSTIAELAPDRTVEGSTRSRGSSADDPQRCAVPRARARRPDRPDRGRIWNDVELLDGRFAEGDAVRVLGRVERFDDRLQLEIRSVEASDEDPAGLAPQLRRDADELDGFLEFLAGELAHRAGGGRRGLLGDRALRQALRELPAAETHHSYAGGLLEHTVGVATLVRETAQLHQRLRGDLALAAALLHDVGRVASSDGGRRSVPPTRVACSATSIWACG